MNNQQTLQTQFSVRVNKEDFLIKAKEAYEDYSKLSKEHLEESIVHYEDRDLWSIYTGHYLNFERLSKRAMNIINMVNLSSDEFVTVTEDIYKLIYKCGS